MPAALPDLFKPLEDCAHVAVAVSGGSDSVCLMLYAEKWAHERGGQPRVSVLTVDHGLRPNSGDEARQVAAWAADLGLSHETLVWTGPKPRTGIQARARQARYDLMTQWCEAHGADALLTGHTLDDQAETVLMRLARTTSLDSLSGIAPRGQWNRTQLVRPLLRLTRGQLRGYLEMTRHPWIDDPSNLDDRFERVRIRNAMSSLWNFGIDERRLANLAEECRDAAALLNDLADTFVEAHTSLHAHGYAAISAAPFLELSLSVRLRVLRRLLPLVGSGKMPLRSDIGRLADNLETAGRKHTLGGALIWRRRDDILIAREAGRIAADPVIVPAAGTVIWDGRFEVTAPAGLRVVPGCTVPDRPRSPGVPYVVHLADPAVIGDDGRPLPVDFEGTASVRARFLRLKSP